MLAALIACAMGIRIIYQLLKPVWPFLLAAIVVFAIVRAVRWYREWW